MDIYGTNGNDVLQNYSNFSDIIFWGRAGDDLLTGNQFRDYIFGEADDDELRGREGNDILNGGTGNDILNGGKGADVMVGGSGWDMADYYSSYNVTVDLAAGVGSGDEAEGDTYVQIENVRGGGGDDHLYGNSGDNDIFGRGSHDVLAGREGPDYLDGGSGDDILNGGSGADIMLGGIGNDIYLVDSLADLGVELYGEGVDTVKSSVSFSLANKYIENIILTGSSNINATGNAYGNRLTGNAGLNILTGGLGDDIYVVQDQDDVVVEKAGQGTDTIQTASSYLLYQDHVENLTLTGSGDTYAIGNPNDNVLRGNSGDNELYGGGGNDTYYVQNKDDDVHESSAAGYDRILSTVTFKLSDNVEYLKLIGSADIDGFGNTGNNTLIGNSGDNKLWGGTGNDTYYTQGNGDRVYEPQNGGHDTIFTDGSYSLTGQYAEDLVFENDQSWHFGTGNDLKNIIVGADGGNTLSGAGGDDVLVGGDGSDALHGGLGPDTMSGLGSNDTYYVDNAADKVIEGASQGTADWVATSVSYALAAGVQAEKFSTMFSGAITAINLAGNEFGQAIIGNAGANILSGKAGNDVLTGAGDADVFFFDTALNAATNIDTITDFSVAADTIWLENAIFAGIVGTGTLTASQFVKNTTGLAADGSDGIIYEADTGKLFYDSNGNAAGGSIQFATLAPNLALTNWDFHIV